MKKILLAICVSGVAIGAVAAPGQSEWKRLLPSVTGGLAITMERAERGDMKSQVELAELLAANHLSSQAAEWYRKAAEQGDLRAKFRLGELLLFGVNDSADAQRVVPNPGEGIRWTFEAATNNYSEACHNMARALEGGLGVAPNLVEAYAWLEVYARSNVSNARSEMDRMALHMQLQDIREAHTVATVFLQGRWPELAQLKAPVGATGLKLSGITVGPVSLAIINGRTFEEGDAADIRSQDGTSRVTCLKIEPTAVQIAIEGESGPRTLVLR